MPSPDASHPIKAIDKKSIHRITSGQVVIDLQTAVKELVENSIDAGATNIEVRFKNNGVTSVEVVDNGSGIAEKDYDAIAMKHHTSKLSSFSDLTSLTTFGFRGEALSSLCALCEKVTVTTTVEPPMGVVLEMDSTGKAHKKGTVARQRGTTILLSNPFLPLPVRRKEFERNAKREFGKAIGLLNAYALVPASSLQEGRDTGIRLTVSNQPDKGQKTVHLRTQGTPSLKASATAVWGPKSCHNLTDLELAFDVERDLSMSRRLHGSSSTPEGSLLAPVQVIVRGLISKFEQGCGRNGPDRQFFYINGRPCNLPKVQKVFNEVYRSFHANQTPLVIADFIIPADCCDINVSPDKRTIFLHNEVGFLSVLKASLESTFLPTRSTYDLGQTQAKLSTTQSSMLRSVRSKSQPAIESLVDQDEPSTASLSRRKTTHSARAVDDSDEAEIDELDEDVQEQPDGMQIRFATPSTYPVVASSSSTEAVQPFSSLTPSIETPHVMKPSSVKPPSRSVTVDVSQASWNQTRITRDFTLSTTADEPLVTPEEPQPKKRRVLGEVVEVESDEADAPIMVVKCTNAASKLLQQRLLSFARPGSNISESALIANDSTSDDIVEEDPSSSITETFRMSTSDAMDIEEPRTTPPPPDAQHHRIQEDIDDDQPFDDPQNLSRIEACTTTSNSDNMVLRPEVIRSHSTSTTNEVVLRFDHERVESKWKKAAEERSVQQRPRGTNHGIKEPIVPSEAGVSNTGNSGTAEEALSRAIDKSDFLTMEVVGQFNLGFIIGRRRNQSDHGDDLFIIDQHASDEKYNFETLQQTTIFKSQRMFKPQPLELTAADGILAMDNLDIIRKNGFEVETESSLDSESTGQTRLLLTAKPVSKQTTFEMKDLEELIHAIREEPPTTGRMPRCSKARAMFAMRACRKSVMIGMPLTKTQMLTVVQHMGTIEQPWNCPHGRPTMRHLYDLSKPSPHSNLRVVNWGSLS